MLQSQTGGASVLNDNHVKVDVSTTMTMVELVNDNEDLKGEDECDIVDKQSVRLR